MRTHGCACRSVSYTTGCVVFCRVVAVGPRSGRTAPAVCDFTGPDWCAVDTSDHPGWGSSPESVMKAGQCRWCEGIIDTALPGCPRLYGLTGWGLGTA